LIVSYWIVSIQSLLVETLGVRSARTVSREFCLENVPCGAKAFLAARESFSIVENAAIARPRISNYRSMAVILKLFQLAAHQENKKKFAAHLLQNKVAFKY